MPSNSLLLLIREVYSSQLLEKVNKGTVRSKPEGSVGGRNTNTLLCVCVLLSQLVTVKELGQELEDLQGGREKKEI